MTTSGQPKSAQPEKWIAALLSLVLLPAGMLCTGHAMLALGYLAVAFFFGVMGIVSSAWVGAASYITPLLAVVGAAHAYWLAAKYPEGQPRPGYSRWYGLLGAIACLAALALVTRAFFFEPFRAPSSSMVPTIPLRAGLVVQKWGYGHYGSYGLSLMHAPISAPLVRGDLVVFEFPSDRSVVFVKRVVGLPGDKIAIRARQLLINGEAIPLRPDGDYYDPESRRTTSRLVETLAGHEYAVLRNGGPDLALARGPHFPLSDRCIYSPEELACEVPAGQFFMLGDNRDNSNDSRMWGFVPADHIVGKVVFVGT